MRFATEPARLAVLRSPPWRLPHGLSNGALTGRRRPHAIRGWEGKSCGTAIAAMAAPTRPDPWRADRAPSTARDSRLGEQGLRYCDRRHGGWEGNACRNRTFSLWEPACRRRVRPADRYDRSHRKLRCRRSRTGGLLPHSGCAERGGAISRSVQPPCDRGLNAAKEPSTRGSSGSIASSVFSSALSEVKSTLARIPADSGARVCTS